MLTDLSNPHALKARAASLLQAGRPPEAQTTFDAWCAPVVAALVWGDDRPVARPRTFLRFGHPVRSPAMARLPADVAC